MSGVNTNDLIEKLGAELKHVRPLSWSGMAKAMLYPAFFILAFRGGHKSLEDWSRGSFELELALSLALALVAFTALVQFLKPGGARTPNSFKASLALVPAQLLFFLALATLHGFSAEFESSLEKQTLVCGINSFASGAFLSLFAFHAARKGAPTKPGRVGALIGLSMGVFGSIICDLDCPSQNAMHILEGHVLLPVLATTIIGYFAGRFYLRW